MKYVILPTMILSVLFLTACGDNSDTVAEKDMPMVQEQAAATMKESAMPTKAQDMPMTTVTAENYDRAETQGLTDGYLKKIADATKTDGMGVLWHIRKGADPKDRTIPRTNYDTIYSWAIFDLTEEVTLEMPETNGRYQTAWFMSEEHYNPLVFDKPGTYKINQENAGSRYLVMVIRTQANTADPKDLAAANAIQDKLKISQKDKGEYAPQYRWNKDEVLKMRAHFQQLAQDKGITSEVMFGKKGERTREQHNAGTAVGWGGFTPKQAVYPQYYPKSTAHHQMVLKDVPTKAFWSVTVYNKGGYAETETYNINSQFAKADKDGSVTINFGGDKNAANYMETFEGWNVTLRIYLPEEAYFNGKWKKPELTLVK